MLDAFKFYGLENIMYIRNNNMEKVTNFKFNIFTKGISSCDVDVRFEFCN